MTNTSKQVENQHLMGFFLEKETGNKEENSRRKTKREKTVLRNHKEILNYVYSNCLCKYIFLACWIKDIFLLILDNVFLRIFIPHSELI